MNATSLLTTIDLKYQQVHLRFARSPLLPPPDPGYRFDGSLPSGQAWTKENLAHRKGNVCKGRIRAGVQAALKLTREGFMNWLVSELISLT